MPLGRLLIAIALIGLAALSLWLVQAVKTTQPTAAQPRLRTPDYFIENFTASSLDEQGRLRDRLRAPIMFHYPHDDSAELTKPHLELYRQDAPPWQIDADKGWVYRRSDSVLLQGNVLIWQDAKDGPIRIITRDVRVQPSKKYAETDAPVTILRNGARVDAVGMRVYFQESRIQLLSTVRGIYDPKVR